MLAVTHDAFINGSASINDATVIVGKDKQF